MTPKSKDSPSIEAFILAAGKSSRLGFLAEGRPKCLLEVGGRTLLDRSLSSLAKAGIERVHLVIGCNGVAIRDHLAGAALPLPVNIIENPYWHDTGSVISLYLAARAVPKRWTLVLESDLLYHRDFISRAMTNRQNKLMVADPSGSGDEVWVVADGEGNLQLLAKQMSAEMRKRAVGEFAGISLFSGDLLAEFCRRADRMLSAGTAQGHYEELICELAQADHSVAVEHCANLPWTEIDTAADFDRARQRILPALEGLTA